MKDYHRPITRDKIAMTPHAILAEAVAFGEELSTEEVEDIIDAGLATGEDFVQAEEVVDGRVVARWLYVGDSWEAFFRDGHPVLVESGTAPRSHGAVCERRFGWAVRSLGIMDGRRLTDDEVAAMRHDSGWADAFEHAAEADRRLAEFRRSGGPRAEVARDRLLRVRQLVKRFGLVPSLDLRDYLTADDESWLGRYLIVFVRRSVTGIEPCEARSCDDLETLVEWAICTTILERRLVGTWDLDADSDDPLVIGCELRVKLQDGTVRRFERTVPFEVAREVGV